MPDWLWRRTAGILLSNVIGPWSLDRRCKADEPCVAREWRQRLFMKQCRGSPPREHQRSPTKPRCKRDSGLHAINTQYEKIAIAGPQRFQWQIGGWFGSVFGGAAWLIPTAVILAFNGQMRLALLPAGCCLLLNVLGVVLWYRRDRILPFRALMGVLAAFAVLTPLVWFAVSVNASPESLASLNWPQQGITGDVAAFTCPAIIAWFCVLEYSHDGNSVISNQTH